MRYFVPLNDSGLVGRYHIPIRRPHLFQQIWDTAADEDVFKPGDTVRVRHRVLLHRQAGERCAGQPEGQSLLQPVLGCFGNLQCPALEDVVECYRRCAARHYRDALGGLRFVFVVCLLGDFIDAGQQLVQQECPVGLGGDELIDAVAGNAEGNAAHLAIFRSLDELQGTIFVVVAE